VIVDDGAMTFFVTSAPPPFGAMDFAPPGADNGLAGADEHCAALALAALDGDEAKVAARNYRAYLSTGRVYADPNEGDYTLVGDVVNARDRIGAGPWRDYHGDVVAASLSELFAIGVDPSHMWTDQGVHVVEEVDGGTIVDMVATGSDPDGYAWPCWDATGGDPCPDGGPGVAIAPTCVNWTVSDPTDGAYGWFGSVSSIENWSSSGGFPCNSPGNPEQHGIGRIYCFASTPPVE
jgi:hypothetical protein